MTGGNRADRALARQQYWHVTKKIRVKLRIQKQRPLTVQEEAKLASWEKHRTRLVKQFPGIERESMPVLDPKRQARKGGKRKKQVEYPMPPIRVVSGGLPASSRRH